MSVRSIRLIGDPVLRTKAEPVTTFDKELRRLVKDLTDTMRDAPGSGLAAPQIGVNQRAFSYNVDLKEVTFTHAATLTYFCSDVNVSQVNTPAVLRTEQGWVVSYPGGTAKGPAVVAGPFVSPYVGQLTAGSP